VKLITMNIRSSHKRVLSCRSPPGDPGL